MADSCLSTSALLLVDLQHDFLGRPGLLPSSVVLLENVAMLLEGARDLGLLVTHTHTLVAPAGTDRMPHWQRNDTWLCVEGTSGAQPVEEARPIAGERVFRKRFFSAFEDPALHAFFQERGVETLLVAGVYLHGCIRSSVLDAYARGFEVWLASDAVASSEPVHAELTRGYLADRAATLLSTREILTRLHEIAASGGQVPGGTPTSSSMGSNAGRGVYRWRHYNPARTTELLNEAASAGSEEVARASLAARRASIEWQACPLIERAGRLERFVERVMACRDDFIDLCVKEVGKPRRAAREEVDRGLAMAHAAIEVAGEPAFRGIENCSVEFRAMGVVGLITPWNNPLAILLGKLVPALVYGNGIVCKPAIQATLTASKLLEQLEPGGVPRDLVQLVTGDTDTGGCLLRQAGIDAISMVGGPLAVEAARAHCAATSKRLQVEGGGNHAAIVLGDVDLQLAARDIVREAFSFAGQRCTAPRRAVVERKVFDVFRANVLEATADLVVGEPDDETTDVGPLVSVEHRERVRWMLSEACRQGARLLCGAFPLSGLEHGAWHAPTVIVAQNPALAIVQQETFGPVLVLQKANDLAHAVELANGVSQGLVASLYTNQKSARRYFNESIEAGIVKLGHGPLVIDARAPFFGWKRSGVGWPEHGIWDRYFYTRVRARYGGLD